VSVDARVGVNVFPIYYLVLLKSVDYGNSLLIHKTEGIFSTIAEGKLG
jgi:hypothetical protein